MISVIVPVYKVEKYIHQCIQSVLKQTYKDYEIILVDDGSPDNCPAICDEYAQKYNNIRVLHKENGGLSDARNAGTQIAKGEYVTYVDSDDYIGEEYLETLWKLSIKYDADICVVGIETFYEGKMPKKQKELEEEFCYTGIEALEKMLYQKTLDTSACAMLLPIEIALANPFPYKKFHEDEFTTYKYYTSVSKVAVTSKKQYFYLQRAGSIMHTFGQASLDELDAADNLVEVCEKKYPDIVVAAKSKKFSDYCQVLLSIRDLDKIHPEIYNRIIVFLNDVKKMMLTNSKARKKNRVAAFLLLFSPKLLIFVNRILKK